MSIFTKNRWGLAGQGEEGGLDQQRVDLFKVDLDLSTVSGLGASGSDFGTHVQVALTKFPFPARDREMIATKYLNQTNYQLGPETAMGTIDMTVRYAIGHEAAVLLEKWHWLTSHPTGGTARTSQVKCNGMFYWLVPGVGNVADSSAYDGAAGYTLKEGGAYKLEGVMIKGFKPSDADMESNNGLVTFSMTLQIDRYYPTSPSALKAGL